MSERCNVVNQLDIVPKAWTDISGISGLYPQLGPPAPCAVDLQKKAGARVQSPNPFVSIRQVTFENGFVQPPPPPLSAGNIRSSSSSPKRCTSRKYDLAEVLNDCFARRESCFDASVFPSGERISRSIGATSRSGTTVV